MKTKNLITAFFYSFLLILASTTIGYAQGWIQTYGPYWGDETSFEAFKDVIQTADGGYIAVGTRLEAMGNNMGFVAKIDASGAKQWEQWYDLDWQEFFKSIVIGNDGGYLIVGGVPTLSIDGNFWNTKLTKIDDTGEIIWETDFSQGMGGFSEFGTAEDIKALENGYVLVGYSAIGDFVEPQAQAYIMQVDNDGEIIWQQYISDYGTSKFHAVEVLENGEFLAVGEFESFDFSDIPVPTGGLIARFDAAGNSIWKTEINNEVTPIFTYLNDIAISNNEAVAVGYYDTNIANDVWPYLAKIDLTSGTVIADSVYTDLGSVFHAIDTDTDGNFVVTGYDSGLASATAIAAKLDSDFNLIWNSEDMPYLPDVSSFGLNILATANNEVIVVGYYSATLYVLKMNSEGSIFQGDVFGQVYEDDEGDCLLNENLLENIIVELHEPSGNIRYRSTDENGFYNFGVNYDGDYTLKANLPNNFLWQNTCPTNGEQTVDMTQGEVAAQNFGLQVIEYCPLLNVSVGTPLLRRCFENNYTVNYCNEGTLQAVDAYIEMVFPDEINVISATQTWNEPQTDNLFVFDLGTIAVGECGSFQVTIEVDCETELGSSLCVETHIFPDDNCRVVSELWDEASLKTKADCDGDNIEFSIKNIGIGNMESETEYRLYEDNLLITFGTIQLEADQEFVLSQAANGSTFRIEADQTAGHPNFSMPRTTIERCGDTPFSLGLFNSVSQDDLVEYIDIDCEEVIGSFDPNDKQVVPRGVADEHFTPENELMTYKIRFQNVGNDTAFTVFILDTISTHLNLNTIKTVGNSHAYEFEMLDERIVKWTFPNILLVDSTTNESASHGFVRYEIQQHLDLEKGTMITNDAGIYFDFNAPVITNKVFNTIGDTTLTVFVSKPNLQHDIDVYPNPTDNFVQFDMTKMPKQSENASLQITDINGRLLKTQVLNNDAVNRIYVGDLPYGVYLYSLFLDNEGINGKLVVTP
ncbi:MAG: DUF7619 domain-containing protein [Chitinophagales bacterium]